MPRPSQLFVPGLRLSTAFAAMFTVLGAIHGASRFSPGGTSPLGNGSYIIVGGTTP